MMKLETISYLQCHRRRNGAALLIVAGIIFASLAIAAYAINVVYIQFTRTELQVVADVASRAACRALVDTGKQNAAYAAAQRLSDANKVAGKNLQLATGDLEFAVATRYSAANGYTYTQQANPNSVQFKSSFFQRTGNSIPMLFPSFTSKKSFAPSKNAIATQAELDMIIVLDCSSSMLVPPMLPSGNEGLLQLPFPPAVTSRWRLAEAGINEMIGALNATPQNEQLGLVTFNNLSLLNVPLSTNYAAVQGGVALQGQLYLGGLSSLADGLRSAVTLLSNQGSARPWSSRVILLISDGKENFGAGALSVAQSAANAHMMIHTISISSEANIALMEAIADTGYGRHFHADTAVQFADIVGDIGKRLPVLITR